MAFETGTATSHTDLLSRLRTFLTTASPTGAGWTELDYNGTNNTAIFEAPGLGASDEIFVGLGLHIDIPGDVYNLTGWMFVSYEPTFGHQAQPGHSGVRYHPIWDTSMSYWFFGNGQRVIIVTKVATVYSCSYLGRVNPYGTAGEFPFPWYVGMPDNAATRYSDTTENFRSFFDPANALRLHVDGLWYLVRNYYESSGEASGSSGFIWPYYDGYSQSKTLYRELRENPDGSYPLFPLILGHSQPSDDAVGELDGAYAIPGFSVASEDTVTIGGDTYDIFQSAFRTARHYFVAIKRA